MGIAISVHKSGETFETKGGKTFYKNKVVGVFAIGETTHYKKTTGEPYTTLNITTEKQLARFLYQQYGKGRYVLIATKKGFFPFFKGEVSEEGWLFESDNYIKQKSEWLEKEVYNAEDNEDADFWQQQLDQNKEELKKEKKSKLYGFQGILKSSGRRGVFHRWDDPEDIRDTQPQTNKKRKKVEDMSIDELNDF